MRQLQLIDDVYADQAWFMGGRETARIQDADIKRAADGIYKPIATSDAEGLELVEEGRVTYKTYFRSGEGDPFPVYMDYGDDGWIYITAAGLAGAGGNNG